MAGTKVHTKFPPRTHRASPVSNARKVLRSNDSGVSRESVIHALRTLYRHRELDLESEAGIKLLVKHDVTMELVTLDNNVR